MKKIIPKLFLLPLLIWSTAGYRKNSKYLNRSKQTVQTQIRLFLKVQSDQGPHFSPFHLQLLNSYCMVNKLFRIKDSGGNCF